MERIAIIPARSGSKGLKDKNILPLNGRPLMAWTIDCALRSGQFSEVFVSTDSREYAEIAERFGADASFLRSERNSSDTAGSWDAVREVLGHFEARGRRFDEVMLLQVTSPLRTPEDIERSVALLHARDANAVLSVTETEHSPLWCNTLPEDGRMDNFIDERYEGTPRQLLPRFYRLNGAIYLLRRGELDEARMFRNRCYAYVMPQERSIDIDTAWDLKLAEFYMRNGLGIA